MSDNNSAVAAFCVGVIVGIIFTLSLLALAWEPHTEQHSEIIKHGAAYYHPETGEFTWRDQTAEDQ